MLGKGAVRFPSESCCLVLALPVWYTIGCFILNPGPSSGRVRHYIQEDMEIAALHSYTITNVLKISQGYDMLNAITK